jgi:hypothetical protein
MRFHPDLVRRRFERGVLVLSIDTEQIWGYADILSEAQYQLRFPDALQAHETLLGRLCAARVPATWFVVGGMLLKHSAGSRDHRMAGLPADWIAKVPSGSEATVPLWYRESFIERLRMASPAQEIGLHGGLTHFIWTDPRATDSVVHWELAEGVRALRGAHILPASFSFGRNEEAFYELLPPQGIRSFRGRSPALAWQLGRTMAGAVVRIVDELFRTAPPPVWPAETLPGLWNIPSSSFFYPIGPARSRIVGLRSRVERFSRGLEAAARCNGIFHFSLHPENLAESIHGFSVLDEMLERLIPMRDFGDIEVLTMSDVVARMERSRETPLFAPATEVRTVQVRCEPLLQAGQPVLKQSLEEQ